MKMKLGMHYESPIFFDLETSGLQPHIHEIIQIGAVHKPSGDTFEKKLFFDKGKASPEALEINHYNEFEWEKTAVEPRQAAFQFNNFCKSHCSIARRSRTTGKPYRTACLIGYNNAHFDKAFLDKLFKDHIGFASYDYRMYDVYELAKWLLPWEDKYKLLDLVKYFDLDAEKAHDALADCLMTVDVAACLIEILSESSTYKMPKWAKRALEDIDDKIPF